MITVKKRGHEEVYKCKYHVVDSDGEVMQKTETAEEAYKYISVTDEAWKEQGE